MISNFLLLFENQLPSNIRLFRFSFFSRIMSDLVKKKKYPDFLSWKAYQTDNNPFEQQKSFSRKLG